MKIDINAKPKEVKKGNFNYSNIQSEYGCNTLYFTKNGKPYTIVAGELHFSRLPKERWRETLLKMQDCGLNTVSTYVFWNYHEEIKGQFDFKGNKDISAFLQICKDIDMPCILRIGPWCHGEVIRGGFPKRINLLAKKRCDNEKYLNEVKEFWQGLYKEVAPFLDGKTVIGLQLENEYTGPTSHIKTLRKIAEEIGFKVPFFTMTAWPSGVPDDDFLPMMGGYPDAPWNRGKSALKPNNRFAITPAKTEDEIGGDLFKSNKSEEGVYDYVPYASCETGPGNQVTQHRRPYISEKDGYGVGFAKFASGVNLLGYYMFCGGSNPNDISFLKCSVRADENGCGYFFSSTYEKGLKYNDFKDVNVTFNIGDKSVKLPSIDIKAGSMFFYPFNIKIGSVNFDYILAQPIAKIQKDGKVSCYFAECEGIEPKCVANGREILLSFDKENIIDDVSIIVIPFEKAKNFHFINGEPYFLDGTVYCDNGTVYQEQISAIDLKDEIEFSKTQKRKLPYNYFLYSTGKREYYKLVLPKDILKDNFDIRLEFDFLGLNLQVFSADTIINDYFNIDKKFVMYLRDYKKYIEKDNTLIIRTSPKTKFGISNVYNEIDIPLDSNYLSLKSAKVVRLNTV